MYVSVCVCVCVRVCVCTCTCMSVMCVCVCVCTCVCVFQLVYILLYCSDDRSQEVFQRSIEAATQMQALSIVDNRPNCLIIDEIDGAPTVRPTVCRRFMNTLNKPMHANNNICSVHT